MLSIVLRACRFSWLLSILLAAALSLTSLCRADSPARQAANLASGPGVVVYLGAALGLPLLSDGRDGTNHSLRIADSIGTSFLVSQGLDALVREKRPNSNSHDSFPSDHATVTFVAATAMSGLHPKQAPWWFLGASAISYSRIRLNAHYPQDVLAGAAIGYGVARWELSERRGLILSPIIQPQKKAVGIQFSTSW